MSRDELINLYRKNRFRVKHRSEFYDFDIDTVPEVEPFKFGFIILTASNPDNVLSEKSKNDANNLKLFKDLLNTEYEFDEACGYLDEHSEESYCIYGMGLEEGIELGKKYNQFSIFYSGAFGLGYFSTDHEELLLHNTAA